MSKAPTEQRCMTVSTARSVAARSVSARQLQSYSCSNLNFVELQYVELPSSRSAEKRGDGKTEAFSLTAEIVSAEIHVD